MKVTEVMTHGPRTCSMRDSLTEPARIMWESDCGCVPVVDESGRTVGMITDRDICMAAYTQGLPLDRINVWSCASRRLVSAREDDSIEEVEALMKSHQIRRVPIVDDELSPVGIVSMNDLARNVGDSSSPELGPEAVVSTLAEVCQPGSRRAA